MRRVRGCDAGNMPQVISRNHMGGDSGRRFLSFKPSCDYSRATTHATKIRHLINKHTCTDVDNILSLQWYRNEIS